MLSPPERAALQQGLERGLPGLIDGAQRVTALQRMSGGASQETWSFELARDGRPALPLVLRRAPQGAAERAAGNAPLAAEARLIELMAGAGVPVPQVYGVLTPQMELGEGFVMERVAGETLGRHIVANDDLGAARAALARQCGRALARIHGVATAALPPLRVAPPREELAHYEVLHRRHGTLRPVFELALRWLITHLPQTPTTLRLVHGDFRNGNLVVGADGLRAVLDWEMAHLGDPMEDLGWVCVNAWRFGRHDLPVGGFGLREDLFEGYVEAGGELRADHVHFWEVFGCFKWGVICEGMAHAYLSGAERNVERAAIGRRASEAEIDLLELLAPHGAAVA